MRTAPFAAALVLSVPLAAQGRPSFGVSGTFGTAPAGSRQAYAGIPDTLRLQLDAGKTRAGKAAAWLLGGALLPAPIPFGPDLLDLDPLSFLLAIPAVLDGRGRAVLQLQVPAAIAHGASLAVQPLVVATGENPPLRLARGRQLRFLKAGADLYVDGDAQATGKGTPYAPFQSIQAALAASQAGQTLHVAPRANDAAYAERIVVQVPSRTLLGDDWKNGSRRLPVLRAPVDGNGLARRATIDVVGTSQTPVTGVALRRLRVLPSHRSGLPSARCVRARFATGLTIEDCSIEGTGRGVLHVTGLQFGAGSQALVAHCTITGLGPDPLAKTTSGASAVGINATQDCRITVRNCRIDHLAERAPAAGPTYLYVGGIQAGANNPASAKNQIVVENTVIGPIKPVAAAGTPYTDADLFGFKLAFGTNGALRNCVVYGLDLRNLSGRVHQVFGFSGFEAGNVELTNTIVQDLHYGRVSGSIRWAVAFEANSKTGGHVADYSCIWNVQTPFLGAVKPGTGVLKKDPLLAPPSFVLKPGSPCLGSGNPKYPPRHMGIFGGPHAGPAGRRP